MYIGVRVFVEHESVQVEITYTVEENPQILLCSIQTLIRTTLAFTHTTVMQQWSSLCMPLWGVVAGPRCFGRF